MALQTAGCVARKTKNFTWILHKTFLPFYMQAVCLIHTN